MKKVFKILLVVMFCLSIIGCSSNDKVGNNSKQGEGIVMYIDFPDVPDFGKLSGIQPEITPEEIDSSMTFVYRNTQELDQEIYTVFSDGINESDYLIIRERTLMEDGGIYTVFQNKINQLMIGEYPDALLISIRPRYLPYLEFPDVPDYGALMDETPSETSSNEGVSVFIYDNNDGLSEYLSALSAYDFNEIRDRTFHEDGYLLAYSNGTHNVVVGYYPTYFSIAIGLVE